VAPVVLPDGKLAAAWTDNLTRRLFESFELPLRGGRAHLAVEDVNAAEPPPPGVSVRAPSRAQLRFREPLRVRVRCDRACDVRITAIVKDRGKSRALGVASLPRRGSTVMALRPGYAHLVPRSSGPLRVIAHACRPNAARHAAATTTVRATRAPVPPLAVPLGVTATRTGPRRVLVRWRTAVPARAVQYAVFGHPRRRLRSFPVAETSRRGRGRTSFRATLRSAKAARMRWVTVAAQSRADPRRQREVTVRVR
jgi:hypothetical protein